MGQQILGRQVFKLYNYLIGKRGKQVVIADAMQSHIKYSPDMESGYPVVENP